MVCIQNNESTTNELFQCFYLPSYDLDCFQYCVLGYTILTY